MSGDAAADKTGGAGARVVLCDLGLGNLRSVVRALEHAGASVRVESDPARIADAAAVVVPGQGAFRDGARSLGHGVGDALLRHIERGRPYLGICLGLQLLFETSDEAPGERGLGVLRGHVGRIEPGPAEDHLKVPHMGWNEVRRPDAPHPGGALDPLYGQQVYFAHSYVALPGEPAVIAATVDYGSPLVCAVERDNILAVQFHPEKSQRVGLAFLAAWVRVLS